MPPITDRICHFWHPVADKPSPPRNLVVSNTTADSCNLTWDAPEDDGGSELTNYIVEKRDASKKKEDWEVVTDSIILRRFKVPVYSDFNTTFNH